MKSLQVFSVTVQTLNFTSTAKLLGMTQPAVSQSIKQLEDHLGIPLFVREHRVLRLSAAGERFWADLSIGLSHIEQSIRTLQNSVIDDEQVTISITTAFATHWLLPRIQQFKSEFPDIDLRFQTTSHDIDLASAGIALAVRFGDGDLSGYRAWHFFDERVTPVCRPGYLPDGPIETAEELLAQRLIHLDEPHRTRLDWSRWFRHLNISPHLPEKGLVLNDYAIVLQTAIEGEGIALGWDYIVKRLLDNEQLVLACKKTVNTGKSFYIVSPSSVPLTDRTKKVRDWLLRQAKEEQSPLDDE